MPPKTAVNSDNHDLQRLSYIVGIITGIILICGTAYGLITGLAFASDFEALEKKHDDDVQNIQIIIYQKDIDALTLKPEKSDYEEALIDLYKDRIEQIKAQ
jgi:hypothetical protein